MKVKSDLFSFTARLDSLAAALAAFFVIQIFSKHSGIGVSPDSVTYLSSARHLVEGRGFIAFDNLPTADFPFGYPFFLTIISWVTRLDPLQFGPVMNGILFATLLFLSGYLINAVQKKSIWYTRILLFIILMSPALQEVYSMIWSETIFLIEILLFIIFLHRYLQNGRSKWFYYSAAICAFACVTRYAGLFLPLSGCCMILLNTDKPFRKRMLDSLSFGSISIVLLTVNILRNLLLTGLATGPRPGTQSGLLQVMENFGGVLCDWLLLERSQVLSVALTCAVLFIFTITFVFRLRSQNPIYTPEFVMAVTGLVYCLFMLSTASLTRYEQFTNRLLSPVYILLLPCIAVWITVISDRLRGRTKWISGLAALLVAAGFLNLQLRADWEYFDGVKDAGIPGYREDEITKSEIVQFLITNKSIFDPRFPIYSNAGDAVYFFTGITAFQLPFIEFPERVAAYYTGYYNNRREYLVWFNDLDNPEMPDLNSILKNKEMLLLKQLPDGAVYIKK